MRRERGVGVKKRQNYKWKKRIKESKINREGEKKKREGGKERV